MVKPLEQIMVDLQNKIFERIALLCEELTESDLVQNNPVLYIKGYEDACALIAELCRELQK